MKCREAHRVSLHPSVRIGGFSLGECGKDVLEGFVVCFEHVNKEALWMMVQHERAEVALLRKKLAKKKQSPTKRRGNRVRTKAV